MPKIVTEKERKAAPVSVRLTNTERDAVMKMAQDTRKTKSEILHQLIVGALNA